MAETGFFGDAELNSASTVPLRPSFVYRNVFIPLAKDEIRIGAMLPSNRWVAFAQRGNHLPAGAIRQSALKHLSDGRSSRPWRKHRPPFGALRV